VFHLERCVCVCAEQSLVFPNETRNCQAHAQMHARLSEVLHPRHKQERQARKGLELGLPFFSISKSQCGALSLIPQHKMHHGKLLVLKRQRAPSLAARCA